PIDHERLSLDLYVFETERKRWENVRLEISRADGTSSLYDMTSDPFAGPMPGRELRLGGLAPEGVSHVTLGLSAPAGAPRELELAVSATPGSAAPRASAPLALAAGDQELWVVVPDGNAVAVLDTVRKTRIASVPVDGRPKSLSVTPDQRYVLVASAN